MKNKLLKFLTILLFVLNVSANNTTIVVSDIDQEEINDIQSINVLPDFSGEESDSPLKH
ncbi:MAG: hypothetical protein HFH94_00645 [Lachnospiraceae bacterium]|nr:hypothetical protein [uncultured Acetatifactor sp.]MCI9218244.1 hypothetical protein [Lachnospiraceae bacterium]